MTALYKNRLFFQTGSIYGVVNGFHCVFPMSINDTGQLEYMWKDTQEGEIVTLRANPGETDGILARSDSKISVKTEEGVWLYYTYSFTGDLASQEFHVTLPPLPWNSLMCKADMGNGIDTSREAKIGIISVEYDESYPTRKQLAVYGLRLY